MRKFDFENIQTTNINEPVRGTRRLLTQELCLVSEKMLQTTKINIENPEHAKIAMDILKKKPNMRYEIELQYLKEAFEHIEFFEKLKNTVSSEHMFDLLKQLKVEHFSAGQTVFNFGDWGEEFYIVTQGAAYVLLKSNPDTHKDLDASKALSHMHAKPSIRNDIETNSSLQTPEHQTPLKTCKSDLLSINDNLSDEEKLRLINKEFPGFFVARTLETGAAFGEIALQNRVRRTATVVCKEKTILGTLTRGDYKRLLCEVYAIRDQENLTFLKSINIFSHLPDEKLTEMYLELKKSSFKKNQIIYKEGQESDNIYFVVSGEVELSKTLQASTIGESISDNLDLDLDKRFSHCVLARRTGQKSKKAKYALIPQGNYFGMEEYLEKCTRINTATVASFSCEVFYIPFKRLETIVSDEKLLQIANENNQKRAWMAQKISSNIIFAEKLLSKRIQREKIEIYQDHRSEEDDSMDLKIEKGTKKEANLTTKSFRRTLREDRRESCDLTVEPISCIDLDHVSAVNHEKLNEPVPDSQLTIQSKPAKNYEKVLRNRKLITSRRLSEIETTYIHHMPPAQENGSINVPHTLKHLEDAHKAKFNPYPSKFHSFIDSAPAKEESIICDKAPILQQLHKESNIKQHNSPHPVLPSVIKISKEREGDDFLVNRALCMKLKLDKILRKDRDPVDFILSNSRSKPTNMTPNQELSYAIRSLSKDSPHVTKIIPPLGNPLKHPMPLASKKLRNIRLKKPDKNPKSNPRSWEPNWS